MNIFEIGLMLAQNALEKKLTIAGLIIMGIMLLVIVVDATAKYKSEYTPKSKGVKVFAFVLLILCAIAIFVLLKIYNN